MFCTGIFPELFIMKEMRVYKCPITVMKPNAMAIALPAAEGITPYKKAVLEPDLEEERRMFYVAMTRAKKELTICWTKKVGSHEKKPSRFLEEMQEEVRNDRTV